MVVRFPTGIPLVSTIVIEMSISVRKQLRILKCKVIPSQETSGLSFVQFHAKAKEEVRSHMTNSKLVLVFYPSFPNYISQSHVISREIL
jgi:hypothetical protein